MFYISEGDFMINYINIARSKDINADADLREKSFGMVGRPVEIYLADFNQYSVPVIQHHWHTKMQFNLVAYGSINFEVENKKVTLNEGEGLFINGNVIHMASPLISRDSMMFSILFDHYVLGGGISQVGARYILPIKDCPDIKHLLLLPETDWHNDMLNGLKRMIDAEEKREFGFELDQLNCLGDLWLTFIRNVRHMLVNQSSEESVDETRIKLMLEYINRNSSNNISLQDIADSAKLSKSECCRCFNRMTKTTPFEYLIQVRVSTACNLIINTNRTIADIAGAVGFNSLSYFNKTFKSVMGMTPSEYKKKELQKRK